MIRVLKILSGTSVDGPGLRTSIYVAGCHHHCPGCHNQQSWDPAGGEEYTVEQLLEVVERDGMNVTLSGGDPMYQAEALVPLCRELKARGVNVWCYTGFRLEALQEMEACGELLRYIDVLVDGPFVEELRDGSLLFRGSSNQRLVSLPETLSSGSIKLWESDF